MITANTILDVVIASELFTEVDPDSSFDTPLHLDSMSLIWLISALENRFAVEIDYRVLELTHFHSINSICNFINTLVQSSDSHNESSSLAVEQEG